MKVMNKVSCIKYVLCCAVLRWHHVLSVLIKGHTQHFQHHTVASQDVRQLYTACSKGNRHIIHTHFLTSAGLSTWKNIHPGSSWSYMPMGRCRSWVMGNSQTCYERIFASAGLYTWRSTHSDSNWSCMPMPRCWSWAMAQHLPTFCSWLQ